MKKFLATKYRTRERMSDLNWGIVFGSWVVLPSVAALLVVSGVIPNALIATVFIASVLVPAAYNAFILSLHVIFPPQDRLSAS